MGSRDPYAIQQTDEKPVQEKFFFTIPGNQVGTDNKNSEPEKRLQVGWYPVYCGNSHGQSEQGKLKDQFPVHKMGLW